MNYIHNTYPQTVSEKMEKYGRKLYTVDLFDYDLENDSLFFNYKGIFIKILRK
jgi:hypothetical protein